VGTCRNAETLRAGETDDTLKLQAARQRGTERGGVQVSKRPSARRAASPSRGGSWAASHGGATRSGAHHVPSAGSGKGFVRLWISAAGTRPPAKRKMKRPSRALSGVVPRPRRHTASGQRHTAHGRGHQGVRSGCQGARAPGEERHASAGRTVSNVVAVGAGAVVRHPCATAGASPVLFPPTLYQDSYSVSWMPPRWISL
jgi:hypothetical protein